MTPAVTARDRLDGRRSQEVFRVLLETLARPGRVSQLPSAGLGASVVPLALAGVDSSFAVIGDTDWEQRVRAATGATAVEPESAPLVAVCGRCDGETIRRLRPGSALAPEEGAKVGIDCDELRPAGPGALTLVLSGPGVVGSVVLGVEGLDPGVVEARRELTSGFPAGIDVWLVDRSGRVAGIPRTTTVEVR